MFDGYRISTAFPQDEVIATWSTTTATARPNNRQNGMIFRPECGAELQSAFAVFRHIGTISRNSRKPGRIFAACPILTLSRRLDEQSTSGTSSAIEAQLDLCCHHWIGARVRRARLRSLPLELVGLYRMPDRDPLVWPRHYDWLSPFAHSPKLQNSKVGRALLRHPRYLLDAGHTCTLGVCAPHAPRRF